MAWWGNRDGLSIARLSPNLRVTICRNTSRNGGSNSLEHPNSRISSVFRVSELGGANRRTRGCGGFELSALCGVALLWGGALDVRVEPLQVVGGNASPAKSNIKTARRILPLPNPPGPLKNVSSASMRSTALHVFGSAASSLARSSRTLW